MEAQAAVIVLRGARACRRPALSGTAVRLQGLSQLIFPGLCSLMFGKLWG
jgi:hypothetical protein